MTSKDFVNWLKGYFEISDAKTLNKKQLEIVKKHLRMVFVYEIDPSFGNAEMQDTLNEIHNGYNPNYLKDNNTLYRC